MERLVEHVLSGGVTGLFLLGTTGEGPSLSYRLRREFVERVCQRVKGRVSILVGITDTAFVESVNLARHAAEAGAAALVVAPPYYLPESQPELQEYLTHLLAELPLPLFLYNMPALTKVSFEAETLRWAMQQPRIAGVKDSSGNLIYFRRAIGLLKERPDWALLMGPEELLADALLAGGHGGVSGGANIFPRLYLEVFRAAQARDHVRLGQLQPVIMHISDTLYRVGRHQSAIIKGIKCALSCKEICNDFMAEPFHRFRAEERARVQECIDQIESDLERLGLK